MTRPLWVWPLYVLGSIYVKNLDQYKTSAETCLLMKSQDFQVPSRKFPLKPDFQPIKS